MSYDRPFAGLKVIDVSQGVAGPYCAMLLAQYGANVIKVEPPGVGDWARNLGTVYGDQCAYSLPANLGKRAIALDLKEVWRALFDNRRYRARPPRTALSSWLIHILSLRDRSDIPLAERDARASSASATLCAA
jgi:CoA transferase family III